MKSGTIKLASPQYWGLYFLAHWGGWLQDRLFLKIKYRLELGNPLNLENPQTFAEKLQWLKLYDRKPIYHQMVDKVESKALIDSIIGPGYTIPTIGVYDSFEEINWEILPQQFILKATHDSGSYYIVRNKNNVDKQKCKKQLYVHWNKDYYKINREWQYKGLESRIIAEPLIAEPKQLHEYKFFCFNGNPKIYQTCYDRDNSLGGAILNFYDLESNLLDIHDKGHSRISDIKTPRPFNFDKMIQFSKLLAKNTSFLRVDFYEVNDTLFLGELTLHENAGFCSFEPEHWNYTLGEWIDLSIDK